MATTTNDLLSAIDTYMLSKGKGMGYLASRVSAIFDDKDAPLNPNTGAISILTDIFDDLQIKIKALHVGPTSPLAVFKKETTWLNKGLKNFTKKIHDTVANIGLFDAYLKGITNITPTAISGGASPYKLTNQGFLKVSVWDMLPKYNLLGIPVYIKNISDHVVEKLNMGQKREKTLAAPIPVETAPKKPSIFNNFINNQQNNKNESSSKGGWLSSLLGIGAGIVGLGWLNTKLNESDAGKEIKNRVKGMLSTLFSKIGAFLTSKEFTGYIKSGFSMILSGFKWLGKDIYNKFANGKISAGIVESVVSYFVLRKLPVVGWIVRTMETFLKGGFGRLFSGIGNSVWTGLTRFGGILSKFLGRASVIGGILTGLYVIWDRSTEIFKIVKDINKTSEIALQTAENTKKGWDAKNKIRNDKITTRLAELAKKEADGTITAIEQLEKKQLLIKEAINSNDASLETIVSEQAKRSSSFFGRLLGTETEQEKILSKNLYERNQIYKKGIKDLEKQMEDLRAKSNENVKREESTGLTDWGSMEKRLNAIRESNGLEAIRTVPVQDATIIQPNSKDQILMAKEGGPFDLAIKQMNQLMQNKLDSLIEIMVANVHATVEGSSAIVKTVASTSSNSGGNMGGMNNSSHDAIRSMRNQVNSAIR